MEKSQCPQNKRRWAGSRVSWAQAVGRQASPCTKVPWSGSFSPLRLEGVAEMQLSSEEMWVREEAKRGRRGWSPGTARDDRPGKAPRVHSLLGTRSRKPPPPRAAGGLGQNPHPRSRECGNLCQHVPKAGPGEAGAGGGAGPCHRMGWWMSPNWEALEGPGVKDVRAGDRVRRVLRGVARAVSLPSEPSGTLAVQSLRPTVGGGATGGTGASETLAWGPWSGMPVL